MSCTLLQGVKSSRTKVDFKLTNCKSPRSENSANTWMESVKDEDREELQEVWRSLVVDRRPITHEFRFKNPWQDPHGGRHSTWVLMSAFPEKDEKGQLKSVFGSITNISQVKWAEDFQKRRMEEAIELKRQQENFIDMTSHEMYAVFSYIKFPDFRRGERRDIFWEGVKTYVFPSPSPSLINKYEFRLTNR